VGIDIAVQAPPATLVSQSSFEIPETPLVAGGKLPSNPAPFLRLRERLAGGVEAAAEVRTTHSIGSDMRRPTSRIQGVDLCFVAVGFPAVFVLCKGSDRRRRLQRSGGSVRKQYARALFK
jgi:hypothetical protein